MDRNFKDITGFTVIEY